MTPERWQRVKEIFSAASELDATAAARYLDAACGDDAELHAEVASLLGAHGADDAILDHPAAAHIARDLIGIGEERWLGRRIGPYKIVALIGHGGMGEVFRARRVDAEYEKEVAIKLVPGGLHAAHVIQRFRAERQILASLDHPNIARLIDGGVTEDGAPYLVMELVEGEPLDRFAAERGLRVRDRLTLFLAVCASVSYAHQRLVVHRDLKPGNILVTATGDVKLLDFGIAKLLQPPGAEIAAAPTVTLMRTLTPSYSSPEQILGKTITTASDVYSLGVVLYVLLTGRSPYRRVLDTAEDAIREVCDTEPLRPSDAASKAAAPGREPLGRDLDAIILRALRKEPERRYASVDQFADDIRRYLDGRPVAARGEDLSYRAGKFIRRHRLEMAAAALLIVTLVGAMLFSLREARIADEQRARAERHFTSVRGLANAFMFQVHDAIENLPGSTQARELLVSTALEYLNTLASEAGDDTALRLELAAAFEKVANIQGQAHVSSKGNPNAALESYSKAMSLLEPIVAAEPLNSGAVRALVRVITSRSRLMLLQGHTSEAMEASKRAVELLEPVVRAQSAIEFKAELAAVLSVHSVNLAYGGAPRAEQEVFARRSIAILEDLVRQEPGDLKLAADLAAAYGNFSEAFAGSDSDARVLGELLALHRKSLAITERLVAQTEGKETGYLRALFVDRHNIARLLEEKKDYSEALATLRSAKSVLADLAADRDNSQVRIDAVVSAWQEGRILLALDRVQEAEQVLDGNLGTIEALGLQEDNLQIVYALAATESILGDISARRATDRGIDHVAQFRHWRAARDLYRSAVPRFERVTSAVTLGEIDVRAVKDAQAGLARSEAAIAKLIAGAPAG